MSDKRKHTIASMLQEGKDALDLYRQLMEWYEDDEDEDAIEEDEFISYFSDEDEDQEQLNEIGPLASAIIAGVAPVIASKLLDEDAGDKTEDIEYAMTKYVADEMGIEGVKKISSTIYTVKYNDEWVTVEFDPQWEEYVYTIDGKGPHSHRSYEFIVGDIKRHIDGKKSDPLNNHNWTMYSISNAENEKKAKELVQRLIRNGFLPFDSKDTGSKYYVILRKRGEDGKGIWKAVKYSNTHDPEIIDITYEQATGREPLDSFHGLRRQLGKALLPSGLSERYIKSYRKVLVSRDKARMMEGLKRSAKALCESKPSYSGKTYSEIYETLLRERKSK